MRFTGPTQYSLHLPLHKYFPKLSQTKIWKIKTRLQVRCKMRKNPQVVEGSYIQLIFFTSFINEKHLYAVDKMVT